MSVSQYIFDDGSVLGWDETGLVQSKDIGSNQWVDDPTPAPAGWSPYSNDAQEQGRMGSAYPANGQSWDTNASFFGVSRLIDTATKAYSNIKGSQAATYAGQNGQTYTNQQRRNGPGGGGDTGLLLLIGAAFLLLG